jgi:epoxyqueuosine reductase
VDAEARNELQAVALEIGFDAAGWTGAQVEPHDVNGFKDWLEAGFHAGMDYLPPSVGRRSDTTSSFAPAQSVLALMVSHAHPEPEIPKNGTRVGRVARYAWSPDYHSQLQPHLAKLEQHAASLGIRAKAYVDHGPILERSFAVRAGLGWRGRSSQVISQSHGALSTLAVLLTDLPPPELETGHEDRCGRCTACVTACPTDAIAPDRTVDSRKCLSYLTIEHRGPIPLEYRSRLGDHLFGCDDCLDVCPWTTHAGRFSGLLKPEADLAHPNLEDFFLLSGHEFEKRYKHSAFSRARRKGMARNAAIVLGNLRDPERLWLLEHGLSDIGWEVREACAWALGRFEDGQARGLLEKALNDADERVIETSRRSLAAEFLQASGE